MRIVVAFVMVGMGVMLIMMGANGLSQRYYENKSPVAYSCGYVMGQVDTMKILNKDFSIVVPAHCAEYVTATAAKGFR